MTEGAGDEQRTAPRADRSARPAASTRPPKGRSKRRRRRIPGWSVPLAVVGCLLVAEVGARAIGPNIPREVGSEERLLIKSDQIATRGTGSTSIVFLGSSETAGGILPGVVDEQVRGLEGVYNAALPGSAPEFIEEWADRIVVPGLEPDVAVIGMLPMSVQRIEATGAEGQVAAIDAYRTAIDTVDPGGLGQLGWKLRQRSALIRWRPYLRSPSLAARGLWTTLQGGVEVTDQDRAGDSTMDWTTESDPRRIARNTEDDGHVLDYIRPTEPTTEDRGGAVLYTTFSKAPVDFDDLESLVAALRKRGVQPVIALAPVDRVPLEGGGADLTKLDAVAAQIVAWGEEHDVPVDDQFTQDWLTRYFHDRNHLATDGAERWSRELGTWLDGLCESGTLDACTSN